MPAAAAAEVDAEVDARMFADHRVIQLDAAVEQCVGVIPALSIAFTDLRVEQGGVLRRVDLDVRAAEPDEIRRPGPENIDDIGQVGLDRRVGASFDFGIVIGRGLLGADQRYLRRVVAGRSFGDS
ncbi:MAG: hypothetical protein R3A46_07650 [Thermomicrobiales bacterium]